MNHDEIRAQPDRPLLNHREIDRGGMGVVYLARVTKLDRDTPG